MREPVDKRSMAVDRFLLFAASEACAINDLTFVLITVMMFLLKELTSTKSSCLGGLELLRISAVVGFHLLRTPGRKGICPF
jgi:hypothetical protein